MKTIRMMTTVPGLVFAAVLFAAGLVLPANAALIHHYTFNTNADDSVGTRDGTSTGNASINNSVFAPVPGGSSGSLDLTSGGYVELPSVSTSPLAVYSIAMWVRINSASTPGALYQNPDWSNSLHLIYETNYETNDKVFRAAVTDSPSFKDSSSAPALNTWIHLAVTVDDNVNELRMYLNGIEDGSASTTQGGQRILDLIEVGDYATGGRQFDGWIDDLRVYDSTLSGSEVMALIPEPNTMGLLLLMAASVVIRRLRNR